MPALWIDDKGKEELEKIKEEMKELGLSTPSYSDAVHRLAKYYSPPKSPA